MIVCSCHRISHRDIEREARAGCGGFEELQERTAVATACGSCREHAEDVFASACQGCPGAARCGAVSLLAASVPA